VSSCSSAFEGPLGAVNPASRQKNGPFPFQFHHLRRELARVDLQVIMCLQASFQVKNQIYNAASFPTVFLSSGTNITLQKFSPRSLQRARIAPCSTVVSPSHLKPSLKRCHHQLVPRMVWRRGISPSSFIFPRPAPSATAKVCAPT
jgi:hypothetical protein